MNEQFRIAQKLGLMFRPEETLPVDIKSWAIKQLKVPSPVPWNRNGTLQN